MPPRLGSGPHRASYLTTVWPGDRLMLWAIAKIDPTPDGTGYAEIPARLGLVLAPQRRRRFRAFGDGACRAREGPARRASERRACRALTRRTSLPHGTEGPCDSFTSMTTPIVGEPIWEPDHTDRRGSRWTYWDGPPLLSCADGRARTSSDGLWESTDQMSSAAAPDVRPPARPTCPTCPVVPATAAMASSYPSGSQGDRRAPAVRVANAPTAWASRHDAPGSPQGRRRRGSNHRDRALVKRPRPEPARQRRGRRRAIRRHTYRRRRPPRPRRRRNDDPARLRGLGRRNRTSGPRRSWTADSPRPGRPAP